MNKNTIQIIGIIVVALTTFFLFFLKIYLNNKKEKISQKRKILTDFFHPICSLLEENTFTFNLHGPDTFRNCNFNLKTEKALKWESLKEKTIIPNLSKIKNIIIDNLDFVQEYNLNNICDNIKHHCIAFTEYSENPTKDYQRFKYKTEWYEEVNRIKNILLEELKDGK